MRASANWRSSPPLVIVVVCVAVFTDIFLYGLIVPVLPFALEERIGLSGKSVQRWSSILLATYGGSILIGSVFAGWIGDQACRRTKQLPFLAGMLIAGGATLLFSLSKSLGWVLIARILQGLSTALIFTIGYSLLLDTVGKESIGHALGFTSMGLSLGLFAGPIVGGFIYDSAGYLAVFGPAFALIVLEIGLRLLLRPTIQYTRQAPPCTGLADEHSSLRPGRQVSNPYVDQNGPSTVEDHPLSYLVILLHSPRFAVAMIGMALLNTFMTAFEAVLPIYLHEVFTYSSTQVAVVFLSNTLPMLFSPLSGALVDRIGPFGPALTGFALAGPSMMLLAMIQTDTLVNSVLLRVYLFLFGCSVSLAMPAMMTEISLATEAVEHAHPGIFGRGAYSQAYGLSNAAFAGGTLAGPLYAGYLREWFGWKLMVISMGVLSLAMAGLICGYTGGERTDTTTGRRDL
ncbi:MFS general substrate transporter [Aspergillus uvarum CBS 121591]|uniref:MFS general substrate transporter n=1 Tax=Aspergillus uvarum CBS 121591 TaxID=1448315 RepID=A0A319CSN4_9EURO|nr:MFS general substrate transporter [Aspergillus uvarum CBS 121591]PYH78578.1 MFS general substrate transporter [Aspergillus uvarum CBS 121591]